MYFEKERSRERFPEIRRRSRLFALATTTVVCSVSYLMSVIGKQRSVPCISRRALSKEPLVIAIGVDTALNEPLKRGEGGKARRRGVQIYTIEEVPDLARPNSVHQRIAPVQGTPEYPQGR